MSSWDLLAGLGLTLERYELERIDVKLGGDFIRSTTIVHLYGGGHEGVGEDVTYAGEDHDALHAAGPILPLAGHWTLASFAAHLSTLDQFPQPPSNEVYRRYRNWAFDSAALDLALAQAGEPLHAVLGREPAPLRFVASLRLPDPPTLEPIERRLAQHPDLQFKLDPTKDWDDALVARIAALAVVAVADLKGFYSHTTVDNPPEPALYQRVLDAFPDACWQASASGSPGTLRSTPSPTSTHWPSNHGCSTSSRRGSAACTSCSTCTTTAPSGASATTAVVRPSSASAAARSNTSRRSFTPTPPTTLRLAPTT